MAARTVTTPNGERWQVRRLWAPRLRGETLWSWVRRRTRWPRHRADDLASGADTGCLGDLGGDILDVVGLIVVVVFVVAFLVLVAVPLLLVLLDLVVLALLTVLGIAARMVFRRPWVVEATGSDHVRHTWRVVGWRESAETVEAIAGALVHGHPPPPGGELSTRAGHRAPVDEKGR